MIFAPNIHLDPILCFYFVPFIAEASLAIMEMRMHMRVFMTTYIFDQETGWNSIYEVWR
jgi:hypothetical protein